jgi:hypothetical protein
MLYLQWLVVRESGGKEKNKMFGSQKHVFWQAFIITLLIFGLGILFGVIIENWRSNRIDLLYKMSEVNLLDVNIQNDIYSLGKFNCKKAIEENLLFADRAYTEAKLLERYQKSSIINADDLVVQHQKYDLLRTVLLLNSLKIRDKCNVSYHDVVYFYSYRTRDFDMVAKETIFSKVLTDFKEKEGHNILLIPIAADMNVSSINLILDKYNVTKEELPVILIDGKIKIKEITTVEELQRYV